VLAAQTLHNLGCQVVTVIFGEHGEHSVHQLAGWCLVDVLGGGCQLDTPPDQLLTQQRIVEAVARQPVYLRDDQILEVDHRQRLDHR
jgi:hypothetical protein